MSTDDTSAVNDGTGFRIRELCRRIRPDDVVLDVGCVRHEEERRQNGNLHAELVERARRVVGADVAREEVAKMRDEGYEVVVADAERLGELPVDTEFDVVVAGELIEHLSNPGSFLDGARHVTGPDGRLVLSTPNPHAVVFTKKALFGRQNNDEHTCWFDEQFIEELASRHRWELTELTYRPPAGGLSRGIWPISAKLGGPGFIAEFRKQ